MGLAIWDLQFWDLQVVIREVTENVEFKTDILTNENQLSSGAPGPVIEVRAKRRIGEDDFIGCLRKSLHEKFHAEDHVVALGGVFLIGTCGIARR